MSLPFTATPILIGKEAIEFRKRADRNRTESAPKKDVEEAIRVFLSVINNQFFIII